MAPAEVGAPAYLYPVLIQNAQDKEAVDKVMGDLDSNNDGEVDFTEFIILVGALTVACNDFFLEYNDKQEKKK